MTYAARSKYDEAGRAARYAARTPRRDEEEWRLIARLLDGLPTAPASALDVPCGAGRMTRRLLERGIATRAADLSPAMRELTLQLVGTQTGFGGVFAADLDAPGSLDLAPAELVLCFRFLPHLPDAPARARVLESLHHLTARYLLLSFHHPLSAHNLGRLFRRARGGRASDRRTLWPSQLRAEAAAQGLDLLKFRALGRFRRELWLALFQRREQ